MIHQFFGYFFRKNGIEPPIDIDRRQLTLLAIGLALGGAAGLGTAHTAGVLLMTLLGFVLSHPQVDVALVGYATASRTASLTAEAALKSV